MWLSSVHHYGRRDMQSACAGLIRPSADDGDTEQSQRFIPLLSVWPSTAGVPILSWPQPRLNCRPYLRKAVLLGIAVQFRRPFEHRFGDVTRQPRPELPQRIRGPIQPSVSKRPTLNKVAENPNDSTLRDAAGWFASDNCEIKGLWKFCGPHECPREERPGTVSSFSVPDLFFLEHSWGS